MTETICPTAPPCQGTEVPLLKKGVEGTWFIWFFTPLTSDTRVTPPVGTAGGRGAELNTQKELLGGHSVPRSAFPILQVPLFLPKTRRLRFWPSDPGCNA